MPRRARWLSLWVVVLAACGGVVPAPAAGGDPAPDSTAGSPGGTPSPVGGTVDRSGGTAGSGAGCTTRITYGDAWIHGAQHPGQSDSAAGTVGWDGVCHDDGANSYALLSNGWKPYFAGHGACVLAFDYAGCAGAPAACTTRATYGAAWLHPANHPAQYDELAGRLTWDRACHPSGGQSYATLSNGWAPHFDGSDGCAISLAYSQCGGLYRNAVLPAGCADPGVLRDGDRYVLTCTSGGAADAFPIYVSTDLVGWTAMGHVFPSASRPAWARGDFWAPEIHRVGDHFVAYFTARHQDGRLSIGAATAPSALGPFTDRGQPLLHDAGIGLIDASEFEAPDGSRYLVWKEDGNAVGKPTPIHGQALAADGLSLVGARATLITNDQAWEGGVVEGPWVLRRDGLYYLFYSGNAYYNGTYAVGVARASNPLGPYEKLGAPILTSSAAWIGPGHCSVVDTPSGETAMVYHAWRAGHVNGPGDGRVLLVDPVEWSGGWPSMLESPSAHARPAPALP
jgi:GH43 family beta-xylosidase